MAGPSDELYISDGSQTLKITDSNSDDYKLLIPHISFKGQNLVVVYTSPLQSGHTKVQFKLTVHTRFHGGVVDDFKYKFDIPTNSSASYSLMTPAETSGDVILEFDKFSGADVTIYNRRNKKFSLTNIKSLTAILPFYKPDDDVSVTFVNDGKSKISGSVSYKQGNGCGGVLFESSGTIAIEGSNKTCYWFMGAQSNVLNVNFNDLQSGGSLEIYTVKQEAPIFTKNNIGPTEISPPIILNAPAFLKIQLGSTQGSFGASVSTATATQVTSSSSSETNLTSTGYPNYYYWNDQSEKFSVGEKDKQVVLSIADLDLRVGEKFTVNATEVVDNNIPVDFPLTGKVDVYIQRSTSKDFNPHRGYRMTVTKFQKIFSADMKNSSLTIGKNLTSLLVKIPGDPGKRISYSISFSNNDTNREIQVIDSSSLLGRPVESGERVKGSTTSNVLLVSLRSTKDKVYLPEVTVNYEQLPCNKSTDHICDGSTRCVPADKMCKGIAYCTDGSDLKVPCSSGPAPPQPPPKVIEKGYSGMAVFIISLLMLTIGALSALYGPDLYKNFQTRYRSGHYTTFQSAE
jgi:hypothetical protein